MAAPDTAGDPVPLTLPLKVAALQDRVDRLAMLTHLGGQHLSAYLAALRELAAARTVLDADAMKRHQAAVGRQPERGR
ncbi:hypothetical protein [Nocardia otitidiscaviarum]|uniref:hypothetical protein n=1 Tax=Nocardia otitidiscaviarum TaxID=1823 RepID=UPI0004A6BFBB|nr:hypothetical protein [Nocardia otitidiscaviarum]